MYEEEKYRKYGVRTSMRVLLRLRVLLKPAGLSELFTTGKVSSEQVVSGIMKALDETGLLNEFCQTVTGKEGVDFMDEDAGVVMWIIHDFFGGLYWQMPASWRTGMAKMVQELVKVGQMKMSETGGMTPATGLTASE